MKKHLFLIAFVFTASAAFSQPTMNSTDMPSAGETYVMIKCDTAGITPGPSGASQTWTFTSKINTGTESTAFVAASSTPGASSFPTATLAIDQGSNNYIYLEITSAQVLILGFYNQGTVIAYTDAQKIFQFPMTYNTTFTDNFAATFMLAGNTVYRTGSITVTGDAHGTLLLPNGTYTNSLRIKTNIMQRDSAFIGLPYMIDIKTEQYEWWNSGINFSLKQIQYDTTTTSTGPTTTTSSSKGVSYFSYQVGLNEVPAWASPVSVYPNPASDQAEIEFSLNRNSLVELVFTDASGRIVKTETRQLVAGEHRLMTDVSELPEGIYMVRIKLDEFTGIAKVAVQ